MSVRVSGAPAVRHNRWLSATAGAMSARPVGYDQETRVLVEKYPEGKACVPSNTVTELSSTRSPAGDHRNGPTLSSVSSVRQLVVPLAEYLARYPRVNVEWLLHDAFEQEGSDLADIRGYVEDSGEGPG